MGGVGVAMAQGDVYSAIQTKTLDGAENNIITYVDLLQYEVAPYYNYTGHLMRFSAILFPCRMATADRSRSDSAF